MNESLRQLDVIRNTQIAATQRFLLELASRPEPSSPTRMDRWRAKYTFLDANNKLQLKEDIRTKLLSLPNVKFVNLHIGKPSRIRVIIAYNTLEASRQSILSAVDGEKNDFYIHEIFTDEDIPQLRLE